MISLIKNDLSNSINNYLAKTYNLSLNILVEEPKRSGLGDLSIPLFVLVKTIKKPMMDIYNEINFLIKDKKIIEEITFMSGFLNIIIDKKQLSLDILNNVINEKDNYGDSDIGYNKTIVLDYSAPNIAKPFSIGHLRSTIIGLSLKRIYDKCGYKTFSINHLGDWGSQFGKVIVAYEKWGNEKSVKENSLGELAKLYVKFHKEAEKDSSLNDLAREVFMKLEKGNKEYLKLWKWFKDESIKDANKMYDRLGVKFDSNDGEAFFNDKMDGVIDELKKKNLLKEDQGAQVVFLENDLPPALIKRSDGASLYITRDLAAVFYRKNKYCFDKCLYVVGNEQRLHFLQLKNVVKKMNYDFYNEIEHVNFGLVMQDGKKMSTRKGRIVTLYQVLNEAYETALNILKEKKPELDNKEDLAEKIGIGSIIFNDLKNHRTLDIEFNLESMLKFEGQTGPYLQYTAVRITSIIRDNKMVNDIDYSHFSKQHYFDVIKLIDGYKIAIIKAKKGNSPSVIAKYLLLLAQTFNSFYGIERILCLDDKKRNANLLLANATKIILENGMFLVGVKPLERM